jgi:hypothetical protein
MNGKIGAFFSDDKQIGGFFDWQLETHVQPRTENLLWEGQAQSYWFKQEPDEPVEARFYSDIDRTYWVGNAVFKEYQYKANKLMKVKIEFSGQGILEAKTG